MTQRHPPLLRMSNIKEIHAPQGEQKVLFDSGSLLTKEAYIKNCRKFRVVDLQKNYAYRMPDD